MGLFSWPFELAGSLGATALTNKGNLDITRETNATNRAIAAATNEANLQINRETNEVNIQMNKENNLLQQALANQAYERSIAKNQLAELMAAGYTQQQAMMLLAGGTQGASSFPIANTGAGHAEAATMQLPAPAIPATMQVPDMSALGGMGDLSPFMNAIAQSLNAEDGGALGWSVAQDYISGVMQFIDDGVLSSDSVTNPADLRSYVDSLSDDNSNKKLLSDFLNSDAVRKVRSFVPAGRAVRSFFSSNLDLKTSEQQVRESYARTMLAKKNLDYVSTQITAQNLENINTELGVKKNILLFNTDLSVCYKNLQNALIVANRDYDINSKTYKLFVENAVKDVENQKALLDLTDKMISIRSKIAEGSLQGLSDDVALIQGYFLSAKESGLLNSTLIGGLLSSTLAVGNEGTQILQKLFDNLKGLEDDDNSSNNPFTAPPHQTRITETWRSVL